MITPEVVDSSVIMHSACPVRKKERDTSRAYSTHARVLHRTTQTSGHVYTARNKRSAAQQNAARDARVHSIHMSTS